MQYRSLISFLAFLSRANAARDADSCLALAMSGGGSNGSWEVGVLWGLAHYAENVEDFYYEVVTGVSAGAINSVILAGYAPEQAVELSEFMSDTWANLVNENIWTEWPEGVLRAALNEKGLLDNSAAVPFF